LTVDRATAYMEKAAREARENTSWSDLRIEYESALRDFVRGVLGEAEFRRDLEEFVQPLIDPGYINALSQLLIKLTAPGVPDVYQGTEIWDYSLVDPDNRRPVDYDLRRGLLIELEQMDASNAWKQRARGVAKMWLLRRILRLRAARPQLFDGGAQYEPVRAFGSKEDHLLGFVRGGVAMTLVPRLVLGLKNEWGDTAIRLKGGSWRDVLTDRTWAAGELRLGPVLDQFPVALLVKERS
jgi:(1->4)-alpha-D-glucan 1-alpha-D-glucosylmutase